MSPQNPPVGLNQASLDAKFMRKTPSSAKENSKSYTISSDEMITSSVDKSHLGNKENSERLPTNELIPSQFSELKDKFPSYDSTDEQEMRNNHSTYSMILESDYLDKNESGNSNDPEQKILLKIDDEDGNKEMEKGSSFLIQNILETPNEKDFDVSSEVGEIENVNNSLSQKLNYELQLLVLNSPSCRKWCVEPIDDPRNTSLPLAHCSSVENDNLLVSDNPKTTTKISSEKDAVQSQILNETDKTLDIHSENNICANDDDPAGKLCKFNSEVNASCGPSQLNIEEVPLSRAKIKCSNSYSASGSSEPDIDDRLHGVSSENFFLRRKYTPDSPKELLEDNLCEYRKEKRRNRSLLSRGCWNSKRNIFCTSFRRFCEKVTRRRGNSASSGGLARDIDKSLPINTLSNNVKLPNTKTSNVVDIGDNTENQNNLLMASKEIQSRKADNSIHSGDAFSVSAVGLRKFSIRNKVSTSSGKIKPSERKSVNGSSSHEGGFSEESSVLNQRTSEIGQDKDGTVHIHCKRNTTDSSNELQDNSAGRSANCSNSQSKVNEGITDSRTHRMKLVRSRRLMKEFQDLNKELRSRENPVFSVSLVNDCLYEWKVKLYRVDQDSFLHRDMIEFGIPFILLNISFPDNFPFSPPFLRVLSPRIEKGFVMEGGAICMELLTPRGWASAYTVEAIITQLAASLVKGQGRISRKPVKDFSRRAAEASFRSLVKTHDKYGWVTPPLAEG